MSVKQHQNEQEYQTNQVETAIDNAIADDAVGIFDGKHHVVYGDYGKLTVCRKSGSLEAPKHLFVSYELYDYETETEIIETSPLVQAALTKISTDVLPYGDIEPTLNYDDNGGRAICRIEL